MRRFFLGAIVAFAGGCLATSNIDRARAHALVAQGAHLVDVRSPSEFVERHPEEAINLPLESLMTRVETLGDKRTPVIVYCHTGIRAAIAARRLQKAGFTEVYNLGTIGHWYFEGPREPPSFQ